MMYGIYYVECFEYWMYNARFQSRFLFLLYVNVCIGANLLFSVFRHCLHDKVVKREIIFAFYPRLDLRFVLYKLRNRIFVFFDVGANNCL